MKTLLKAFLPSLQLVHSANEDFYDAWRRSFPSLESITNYAHDVWCSECHRGEIGVGNNRFCHDTNHHFFKYSLRNYGCNCWPDNYDSTWNSGRARQFGISMWTPGDNGKPVNSSVYGVDEVDAECHRTYQRLQCLTLDHANGDLRLIFLWIC